MAGRIPDKRWSGWQPMINKCANYLNPPQLGPIEISLHVKAIKATAVFSSANADVREAIETALPRLRKCWPAWAWNSARQTSAPNHSASRPMAAIITGMVVKTAVPLRVAAHIGDTESIRADPADWRRKDAASGLSTRSPDRSGMTKGAEALVGTQGICRADALQCIEGNKGPQMTKEEKVADEAAETPPKKSKKKLIIIPVLVLVLLLVVGSGAALFLMKNSHAEGDEVAAELETKRRAEAHPVYIPMDTFTVNLVPETGDQYLQVTLSLESGGRRRWRKNENAHAQAAQPDHAHPVIEKAIRTDAARRQGTTCRGDQDKHQRHHRRRTGERQGQEGLPRRRSRKCCLPPSSSSRSPWRRIFSPRTRLMRY